MLKNHSQNPKTAAAAGTDEHFTNSPTSPMQLPIRRIPPQTPTTRTYPPTKKIRKNTPIQIRPNTQSQSNTNTHRNLGKQKPSPFLIEFGEAKEEESLLMATHVSVKVSWVSFTVMRAAAQDDSSLNMQWRVCLALPDKQMKETRKVSEAST